MAVGAVSSSARKRGNQPGRSPQPRHAFFCLFFSRRALPPIPRSGSNYPPDSAGAISRSVGASPLPALCSTGASITVLTPQRLSSGPMRISLPERESRYTWPTAS